MIVLISGSMNSGKSTVARILIEKIPRTAHIEKLRQYIEWMPIEESIPFNIKNIISLTKNFSEGGLNVLISYPVSSENFRLIEAALKASNQQIQAFTLAPRLEVVTSNRGERKLKNWEIEVITKSYEEGIHKPNYGEIIDNSELTAEETAELIFSKLSVNKCT